MKNSSGSEGLKKNLGLLREKYARELPEKIDWLRRQMDGLSGEGPGGNELDLSARAAHTLAGSAPAFGFTALGQAARQLERLLKGIKADSRIAPGTKDECMSCIETMLREASSPAEAETGETFSEMPLPPADAPGRKLVFLGDDDELLLNKISLQLEYYGYEVRPFARASDLSGATAQSIPSAIVIDIMFPDEMDGIEAAGEIRKSCPDVPVIFMSNRNDLETRIRAFQAGGGAYLLKPPDTAELIDMLDAQTGCSIPDPYRVLIVDDDRDLAEYYSLVLKQASIETKVVTEPLHLMDPLIEFKPDLILMDLYMPGCSGFELAGAIRQIKSYVSIPIVFLSAERDAGKQLAAMSKGGDDFLTKSIEPAHLISSVRTRAERMRIIRSFMNRDGLTGLLNHTKLKEQLDIMTSRAARMNSPLSFAMIDVDKFKAVNDTYGHPVGDKVLFSLSRLLQQRIRKTDIIGRYGGEEFAVIFMDANGPQAQKIMDGLREDFSRVKHYSDKGEFSVTFSCGVASFPDFRSARDLGVAADKALYEAKRGGRNRVVAAVGGPDA